jgi:predicted transcriptional regulator
METKINIELIDKKLKKRKLNRSGFAIQLGISRALLSYYINNPTLKSIEIIADGLGLSAKDLLK